MAALTTGLEQRVSAAEWQARCELAATYRIAHHLGWNDLINTHISARVPDEPGTFLINHHGQTFDEITASSLVKMDLTGNVIGADGRFNPAGLTIHSGVYVARPDAMCVLHSHTRAGAGISMLRQGIRPISQDALHVLDDISYHAYGIPTTKEEGEALGRSVAGHNCIVLLNHGLLVLAASIHSCVYLHYRLERACELELVARSFDEEPLRIDEEIIRLSGPRLRRIRSAPDYGLAEYQALVRTIERTGVAYRS